MGRILLRPDDDLQGNVYFGPYLSHYWTDFAILPLAKHALHTVSIWLRSTTNDGQFVYTTYRLLAYTVFVFPFLCSSSKLTLGRKREFHC